MPGEVPHTSPCEERDNPVWGQDYGGGGDNVLGDCFLHKELLYSPIHLPGIGEIKFSSTLRTGAHSLFNNLVVEGNDRELGSVVVDEVHMLGKQGRGAGNLEPFLLKFLYMRDLWRTGMQIVAKSATEGNLRELGVFLRAELLTDKNRLLVFVMVVRIKASEEGTVVCRKVSEDELMVKQMGQ